jgi:hypothetical protein
MDRDFNKIMHGNSNAIPEEPLKLNQVFPWDVLQRLKSLSQGQSLPETPSAIVWIFCLYKRGDDSINWLVDSLLGSNSTVILIWMDSPSSKQELALKVQATVLKNVVLLVDDGIMEKVVSGFDMDQVDSVILLKGGLLTHVGSADVHNVRYLIDAEADSDAISVDSGTQLMTVQTVKQHSESQEDREEDKQIPSASNALQVSSIPGASELSSSKAIPSKSSEEQMEENPTKDTLGLQIRPDVDLEAHVCEHNRYDQLTLQIMGLHKQPQLAEKIGKEFALKHLLPPCFKFGWRRYVRHVHFWDAGAQQEFPLSDIVDTFHPDSPCVILIICMNRSAERTLVSTHPSIHFMDDTTGAFFEYYKALKPVGSLLMSLSSAGDIFFFAPSLGHPHLIALPKITANWLGSALPSPMLHQKVELSEVLSESVSYLRQSRRVTVMPEVLIIHLWSSYCKGSQAVWPLYEQLRTRLPEYTHVLFHLNHEEHDADVDSYLIDFHPDMVLVDDPTYSIIPFRRKCNIHTIPTTVIIVKGVVEYVGDQHINCEPLYFPTLIHKALHRHQ